MIIIIIFLIIVRSSSSNNSSSVGLVSVSVLVVELVLFNSKSDFTQPVE